MDKVQKQGTLESFERIINCVCVCVYVCVCARACVCGIPETGGEYCRAVLVLNNSPVHGIVLFATAVPSHWGLTVYE